MLKFEEIEKYIAKSDVLFEKSKNIVQKEGVGYVHTNNGKQFTANVVEGENDFYVKLDIDNYSNCKCNCDFFTKYSKCQHVASLMYKVHEQQRLEAEKKGKVNKQIENGLFDLLSIEKKGIKYINIRPKFFINSINNEITVDFVVKYENQREFIVKDKISFITSVVNCEYYKINNSFELFEHQYKLNEKSQKLIDILKTKFSNKMNNLMNKELELTPFEFNEILKIYSINEYLDINHNEYQITKGPIKSITLNIEYDGDDILFTTNNLEKVHEISENIIKVKNNIYNFSESQMKIYKVFSILITEKVHEIRLNKKYFENFIINLKEGLKSVFNIEIAKELDKEVISVKLETYLNIIRDKKNIIIQPIFEYGDIKYGYDNIQISTTPRLVTRNLEKEKEVMSLLNDMKYKDYPTKENEVGYIKLTSQKEIYNFFRYKLKKLHEIENITINVESGLENILKTIDSKDVRLDLFDKEDLQLFDYKLEVADLSKDEINKILLKYEENNEFEEFHVTDNFKFIELDDEIIEKLKLVSFIEKEIKDKDGNIPLYNLFFIANEAEELFEYVNFSKVLRKYIDKKESYKYKEITNTRVKLRDYQKEGVKWVHQINDFEFGGVVADEMGLGKTLQMITFLNAKKNKKSLIVVPKALIYNWSEEIKKFGEDLTYKIIDGKKSDRINDIQSCNSDIIITSYNMLRLDIAEYEENEYDYIILDEAQYIKNPKAQISKMVRKLNGKTKFALTGTPIENNLVDLWSIFNFVMPGFLQSQKKFEEKYLKENGNIKYLKKQINPFVLRRLKVDVLSELPDKIEKPIYCDMNKEQKVLYGKYAAMFNDELKDYFDGKNNNSLNVLSVLTRLRQIATHPKMFLDSYEGKSEKLDVLVETIINNIENNNKMIIFSQFVTMLDLIKDELIKNDIEFYYLDGKTKARDRVKMTKDYNNDEKVKVFLISLKAGGVGLNLTSANTVIHVDPWWNPAIENQATDRAHRIGQKDVVIVNKFITKGTIEEKIFNLKNDKIRLADDTLQSDMTMFSEMSKKEIKELFDFE